MTENEAFDQQGRQEVQAQGADRAFVAKTREWMDLANSHRYSYHFKWLGRPVIQYPQDVMAMQELIWATQPDLIIETGIARGGSLVFLASMLELLAACGGAADGRVVGVDIDIRPENRAGVEQHPLARRITMLQGSSVAPDVVRQVKALATGRRCVMVILDSNHTHEHVLAELRAYAPLVTVGSYCVVMDTIVEDLPADAFPDRPWGKGDNPRTAVREYLSGNDAFVVENAVEHKLMITVAPGGFLRRVR
jgi:cephalosporin hydroxylase